jgi:hypothetical protein
VVPGFKYDIFISYSHVDNLPLGITKKEPGWVDTLVDNLKTMLAHEFGQLVNIWFARRLTPDPASPEKNLQAVCRSTLLVPIISEGYLASAWCTKERKLFVEANMRQGQGIECRIFLLQKTEMDYARMPVFLEDLSGYQFFKIEHKGARPRTLGMPMFDSNDQSYFRILYDLSRDIAQTLRKLQYERASLDTPTEREDSRPAVFLSYSRKDQAYVQALTDYLENEGLSVWVADRIDHSDRWWQTIRENIHKCAAIMVVMTPDSRDSGSVIREITFADMIDKPVFPLLLGGNCFPLFENQQYHDVRDGSMPSKVFIAALWRLVDNFSEL